MKNKSKFNQLLSKNKLLVLLEELLSLYPNSKIVILTYAHYHALQEAVLLRKFNDELILREEAHLRSILFFIITNLEECSAD